MKLRSLSRLGLTLAALMCLFAAFSPGAFGASQPAILSPGVSALGSGPNHMTLVAEVNPNGAATTVGFEYRKVGTSQWLSAGSKAIGAGTSYVESTAQAFPISQLTHYEERIWASNSFGLTSREGSETFGLQWDINKSYKEHTSEYAASNGTFRIEWYQDESYRRIECSSSGSGEFGPEAVSESFKLTTSGCAAYKNNTYQCSINPITLNLNNYYGKEGSSTFYVDLCAGPEQHVPISFSTAFSVTDNSMGGWVTSHSVDMSASAKVSSMAATITNSGTWQLSGKNAGKTFALDWYL